MTEIHRFIPKKEERLIEHAPQKPIQKGAFKRILQNARNPKKSTPLPNPFSLMQENTQTLGSCLPEKCTFPPPTEDITIAFSIQSERDIEFFFEKLVSQISIMIKEGITTTHFTIGEEKETVFRGCEITLKQYDTSPSAMNIELQGTPEGTVVFNAHLANLESALKQTFGEHAQFYFSVRHKAFESKKQQKKRLAFFQGPLHI
jgi:hypothetical protein